MSSKVDFEGNKSSKSDDEVKEKKANYEGDENEERGNWSNPVEFVLSCVGYAVGLGNVWRFPIKCYKWGGGNFLVLYWFLAVILGFPIILLEQTLGQFTSQGPTHCWRFARAYQGIGIAMCAVSLIVGVYYTMIIGWAFYYMFSSFQSVVPWQECQIEDPDIWWTSWNCRSKDYNPERCCFNIPDYLMGTDGLCYNKTYLETIDVLPASALTTADHTSVTLDMSTISNLCNKTVTRGEIKMADTSTDDWKTISGQRGTASIAQEAIDTFNIQRVLGFFDLKLATENGYKMELSSSLYFNKMMGIPDTTVTYGLSELGPVQWQSVLCLLLGWIIVFVCLINGIKSAGKVVWFTAIAPYVILLILLIRANTLDGSYQGVLFYLTPKWEKFGEIEMWFDCVSQLFFSLSACWGGMIALSSYNRFHNNLMRDTIITVSIDSFTSFFAGFAIFGIIGHFAHITDRPIDSVVEGGPGLAFKVYPMALTYLPGTIFWSILFAALLVLLGLDSEFNIMETVFTVMLDFFPFFRQKKVYKAAFFGAACFVGFLLGLPYTTPGGSAFMDVIDQYGAGWCIMFIGVMETTAVGWVYGFKRFGKHINYMSGGFFPVWLNWILGVLWCGVTPILIFVVMVITWVDWKATGVPWADAIGWLITIFVMGWIPGMMIYHIFIAPEARKVDGIGAKIKSAFTPAQDWGPYLEKHREEVSADHDSDIIIDGNASLKRK